MYARPTPTVSPESGLTQLPALQQPTTDWVAVALGIIAFLALMGLIPLWYAVYLRWAGL
jgi:hypothetical protein